MKVAANSRTNAASSSVVHAGSLPSMCAMCHVRVCGALAQCNFSLHAEIATLENAAERGLKGMKV